LLVAFAAAAVALGQARVVHDVAGDQLVEHVNVPGVDRLEPALRDLLQLLLGKRHAEISQPTVMSSGV
jgi:hypothetical protein